MDIIIIVFALMLLLSLRKSKEDFLSKKLSFRPRNDGFCDNFWTFGAEN